MPNNALVPRFLLAFVALCASANSLACSIAGYSVFAPNVSAFEPKYDKDENVALLPQPIPKLIGVKRGSAAPGSSCDDAGIIELEVAWPASSEYKLEDVGFYFRVVAGKPPDLIFPLEPAIGRIKGRRMRFLFAWLDGHPSKQLPIDLKVEVFAVNGGLQIGPSAFITVRADRG